MKLLIKEIIEKIQEFDKANHEFRFKSYDVYDHKGEIFVEYVTQCDYNYEGESVLMDKLVEVSNKEYDLRIYLHYQLYVLSVLRKKGLHCQAFFYL